MIKKVLHNQSILDIALQHTGTVENSFRIAIANGLSISDTLSAGLSLEVSEGLQKNTDIYNYYVDNDVKPATGVSDPLVIPTLKGIGYMRIGGDFKVS
ncbi:hypothetical protein [Chryseobacterium sp. KCF3-3]|uniref:hypothetical protein n=1 Tax=Chryseobacterium sp. KCF3-3 TaxID=3231511 RepID=UPI0038B26C51